ncbi:MAG: glycine--tRNA ligase [Candidatus Pacebacteria bacterium]|nr:glycine--tRNA ligase [Candidatus Paceibacterota bacterium]
MDKITSLAKRRGFIYRGSEIYGGLAGTWDYGPLGVRLKENIKNLWRKKFIEDRDDMYEVDAALIMNPKVWQASGHAAGFTDPLVECKKCGKRFRADQLRGEKCPECKGVLSEERTFNMMFQTYIGAAKDDASLTYLRPETAQGMFVNFKNILDTFHPKLPFGLAQIGKAFRNEIAPRDFLFRAREFEQMEIEYFIREGEWKEQFEKWREEMLSWCQEIGLPANMVHEKEVEANELAHYSKRTIDFEFDFPFGRSELYGLAYRTDFDLRNHTEASGVDLSFYDEESKERFIPHVIEPTFGIDRTVLALLVSAYNEDSLGEEGRVFLKLPYAIAPVKVAVFPLLKNKPELVKKAKDTFDNIRKKIPQTVFDDNGNIGKRYRRQDEIGTPFCVTIDFDTLEDGSVTLRDRDTGEQKRISVEELLSVVQKHKSV